LNKQQLQTRMQIKLVTHVSCTMNMEVKIMLIYFRVKTVINHVYNGTVLNYLALRKMTIQQYL